MATRIPLALLATALACSLFAAPAHALRARVFVAKTGADVGSCSFSAPCQSLNFAYNAVLPGGEITMIDNAGYEPLTINKALTITSPAGVEAGITTPPGGTAITISAGPNDVVVLRGLTIDGGGTGNVGIQFDTGKLLSVESCVVRNFSSGLSVGNNGTVSLELTVSNSYFNDNSTNGIVLAPNGSGVIFASIDRTVLSGNGFAGLNVIGQSGTSVVRAAVTDSVAANNLNGSNGTGFLVQSAPNQAAASLTVTHSSANGNNFGISAFGTNAALLVGQSTVTDNITGYSASSNGFIYSYGDNYIDTNGNNAGSLNTATKK
jgi:hypothetical protein